MVIALLLVLGVDLVVVVVVVCLVVARRRWVRRQPGGFSGEIRLASGDLHGLAPTWKRGYGRWVKDVLVWNKAPLMVGNALVPVDRVAGERQANAGEAARLGDRPVIFELVSATATVELAARASDRVLAGGPRA